jgi:rhodanese-related sulfurtransferase
VLLDVREPWEFQTCSIAGSRHLPMREVPARKDELDPDAEVVVICHHGGRSMQVAVFLEKNGFARVHNLAGGVDAWAKTVDPSMPVY